MGNAGNVYYDSGECYYFNIPGNVTKDSGECSKRFREMFKKTPGNVIILTFRVMLQKIPGNAQEDFGEFKFRFIL